MCYNNLKPRGHKNMLLVDQKDRTEFAVLALDFLSRV